MPRREYMLTYMREYRKRYPEKCRERKRRWRQNHSEYPGLYYQQNKEKILQAQRENYHLNIEHARKMHNARNRAQQLPLASMCEFCESLQNLERHHPDYEYWEIYVTCCRKRHRFLDEKESD